MWGRGGQGRAGRRVRGKVALLECDGESGKSREGGEQRFWAQGSVGAGRCTCGLPYNPPAAVPDFPASLLPPCPALQGDNPVYLWVPLTKPRKRPSKGAVATDETMTDMQVGRWADDCFNTARQLLVPHYNLVPTARPALPPHRLACLQVLLRLQWTTEAVRGQSTRLEVNMAGISLVVMGGLQVRGCLARVVWAWSSRKCLESVILQVAVLVGGQQAPPCWSGQAPAGIMRYGCNIRATCSCHAP